MDDDFLLILRVFADATVNSIINCYSAILLHIHNKKYFEYKL
jgi:hypothetical protein